MKHFTTIKETKDFLRSQQKNGKKIGLVPTMGYLHEGHLSLIKKSISENDITAVSIFVNPTQFGPNEDLEKYPRDLERDLRLCKQAGADIVFAPNEKEMYPKEYLTYVYVKEITKPLCGASRPTHFEGVTTVVSKLFHIICPNHAYFGQKDAQQAIIIKQMVNDLNMDVIIRICPIIREKDGLAMSSRNAYLTDEQRRQAVILYQSLMEAKKQIESGEKDSKKIKNQIEQMIKSKPLSTIDYISIVDAKTLKDIEIIKDKVLIALAIQFGNTRLIDNILLEV